MNFGSESGSEDALATSEASMSLSLHATEFISAVDSLSIALIRYNWEEYSFNSSVVGYAASYSECRRNLDSSIPARNILSLERLDPLHATMALGSLPASREKTIFIRAFVEANCQRAMSTICDDSIRRVVFARGPHNPEFFDH